LIIKYIKERVKCPNVAKIADDSRKGKNRAKERNGCKLNDKSI